MRAFGRLRGPLLSVMALVSVLAVAGFIFAPAVIATPSYGTTPSYGPVGQQPAWQTLPLVDARTGQSFTLADFAGKTVYVEPMATWCTNCRQQMGVIRDQVRGQVDPEQVVFVGLSVETTLAADQLATYVDAQGFGWTFAVMTPELLQELATQFGRTVTNPPAVPHFVISPDGTFSNLSTGFHSADQLVAILTAGGMAHP